MGDDSRSRSGKPPTDPDCPILRDRDVDSSAHMIVALNLLKAHERMDDDLHAGLEKRIEDLEKWHGETLAAVQFEEAARKKRSAQWDIPLKAVQLTPGAVAFVVLLWAILRWAAANGPPNLHP